MSAYVSTSTICQTNGADAAGDKLQLTPNGIIVFMRYIPHIGNGSLSWCLSSNTSYSLEMSAQLFGVAQSALPIAH